MNPTILIYPTDKNRLRKETCQVNFFLCNDPLRHFNMLLQGSALALASGDDRPGRSVFFHSCDGCWQCKRWLRRTLEPGSQEPDRTLPAITIFHFFLPTAPLERKEENSVHGLYYRHLPQVGPTYSHFWLSFPGGSCPRTSVADFLTAPHGVLLSCLPHLPFPHSLKPP